MRQYAQTWRGNMNAHLRIPIGKRFNGKCIVNLGGRTIVYAKCLNLCQWQIVMNLCNFVLTKRSSIGEIPSQKRT